MFYVCPACEVYSVEKEIDPIESVAICPSCGHRHPFLRLPLFILTGASGVGKTTVCLRLGVSFEVHSAGTEATRVHPLAIRAMAEVGIDISGQTSKTLAGYLDQPWDVAVTVCDHARDACPVFPSALTRLHWSFPDPSQAEGAEEARFMAFRTVRDAIGERIRAFLRDFPPRERTAETGRARASPPTGPAARAACNTPSDRARSCAGA